MAKRRRRPVEESSSMMDELGTEAETLQTEVKPRQEGDALAITLDTDASGPETGEESEEGFLLRSDKIAITAMIRETVEAVVAPLRDMVQRQDQRSRDRMHATFAEATGRAASIEDRVDLIERMAEGDSQTAHDIAMRLERVEEACGLRPSLLTTAESAVSQLDEMAQDGSLRAEDIRAIHRKLRAATQQERARRQN